MSNSNARQHVPTIYTLDEINTVIAEESFEKDLIDGIQDGFVALENKEFFACPIQTMGIPPFPFLEVEGYAAQTCVKSGYFKNGKYYVIKIASGGSPHQNSGLMQVFSQKTGKLEAILLDDGILTEVRTAAIGALAAKLLAPKAISAIGMLGTGIQARFQLGMLSSITDCRKVIVWGRTISKVELFKQQMNEKGWEVLIAEKADDLLRQCDLVITTTCAREAVLGLEKITEIRESGLHITCIGADASGKMELAPGLVAKADFLVADTVDQTAERGEFEKALSDRLVSKESILSLGKLIELPDQHRKENDNRLTIFDSSGVALQDCIVAQMTYDALISLKKTARRLEGE
jgi:ornithine cyclodeaminase